MNPSHRCAGCGSSRHPGFLRRLCPACHERRTRGHRIPGDLEGSVRLWDGPEGPRIEGYALEEEIGRGDSGIVYRAHQVSLDRKVAVKLLHDEPSADGPWVERLRIQAEAAAALDHPAIVPIHEVGESDGRIFYSMRLVPGPTLERVMHRFCLPATRPGAGVHGAGPDRSLRNRQLEIARFLAEIADAVHHAHRHGVLHGDLRPGNVLTTEEGHPVITGFGLARVGIPIREGLDAGTSPHSPNHIAPELIPDPGRSSVACDVYSIGAIGYECLTGEPPFEAGDAVETLIRIRSGTLTPPRELEPSIDADLEAILVRCLESDPARRYPSAGSLAEDLKRFAAGVPVEARDPGWRRAGWHWIRRHPWISLPLCATGLGLVALAVASLVIAVRRDAELRRSDLAGQHLRATLEESTLGRLRAERLSGIRGRRSAALETLQGLDSRRTDRRILDEAIAQLAHVDLPDPKQLHGRIHPGAPIALTPDFKVRLEGDGTGHVIASDHGTGARIWEWGDGDARRFLEIHPAPDGSHLLAVRKGAATLLRFPEPGALAVIPLVDLVGFGPEGDWFMVLDAERRLNRYETRTGRHLGVLPDGSIHAGNIAICPDPSRTWMAVAAPGQIRIVDWSSGAVIASHDNTHQNGLVQWVGNWLVQLVDGTRILGYHLHSGREYVIAQFTSQVLAIRPVPRHNQVAVLTVSGDAGLFDLDLRTRILALDGMAALQFDAEGSQMMVAIQDSWAVLPYEDPGILRSMFLGDPGQDSIRSVSFSPDGSAVAVTKQAGVHLVPLGSDRNPEFLPAMGAVETAWIPGSGELVVQTRGSLLWHAVDPGTLLPSAEPVHVWDCPGTGWMDRGAFCPETPSLMVVRPDSRLEEIDLKRRKTLRVVEDPRLKGVRALDHSGDEIVFNTRDRGTVHSMQGLLDRVGLRPNERIEGFRFSPDGRSLMTASGSLYRLIPTRDGAPHWERTVGTIIGDGNRAIAWGPDSLHVALVTGPNTIGVFRAEDGERIAQLTHPSDVNVTAMAISPGNQWLGIGLENGTLHLWDIRRLLRALRGLGDKAAPPSDTVTVAGTSGTAPWRGEGGGLKLRLGRDRIKVPQRDPRCTGAQLDLGPSREGVESSGILGAVDPRALKTGFVQLGEAAFDARWTVHLDSRNARLSRQRALPVLRCPLGIPVLRRIHLLAAANAAPSSVSRPLEIARVRLHYRDGSVLELPIRLGVEVEDLWSQDDTGAPGKPTVAWRGMDPSSEQSGRWVQSYHCSFVNPHPDRPVDILEIESSMALPSLLISGITLE